VPGPVGVASRDQAAAAEAGVPARPCRAAQTNVVDTGGFEVSGSQTGRTEGVTLTISRGDHETLMDLVAAFGPEHIGVLFAGRLLADLRQAGN
jgi:hypothetical protein